MKTEKNILIAFILNLTFSILEFFGSIMTNSYAILSDSIHDLGDAISIGISYILERISKRKPDNNYTFGYLRYSVLGGLITTVILLVGSLLVIYHSIFRIINPEMVDYSKMIIFAIFGVIVNFIAAHITHRGNSFNQKSVNLHMLEDVLGWVVVLVGAIIMKFTNLSVIDTIMSIIVSIYILIHASKNFIEILNLFLEKIPNDINIEEIKKHLLEIDGVIDIHHIHIWSMDGIENFATMHIVTDNSNLKIKSDIRCELKSHDIAHVTIELENISEKCLEHDCKVSSHNKGHHGQHMHHH